MKILKDTEVLANCDTSYSYNINDVSTLFPYRRTTIIIDGGECLVGETRGLDLKKVTGTEWDKPKKIKEETQGGE